ncbi:LOW QUALITY PROTEIN: Hypothetical protein PHPALM_6567 [Phytophthora palmivora]|uniref:Uncharacterized protein n=1 Tax=Phytophthora palmivora TaxID=4796 RepID=A0A2P4YEG7_9STRA|nr:LOW QUALITY PROTEIN: Hypothetical protein PHPALM_6567 [Phytophthora palmivora]
MSVVKSVVNSGEPRILNDLARYTFEKKVGEVSDSDIMAGVDKKCSTMLNPHASVVEDVFRKTLKLNRHEQDTVNRAMAYFVNLDRLVEEHGLTGVLGPEKLINAEDGKHRRKDRCKILMDNLAPRVFKTDIKDIVSIQHCQAKTNDVQLHWLMGNRAAAFLLIVLRKNDYAKKPEIKRSDGGKEYQRLF